MIPLVDLKAQYRSIGSEIDPVIRSVVSAGAFIGGEEVRAFEAEFAAFCSGRGPAAVEPSDQPVEMHCAACANGTDALYLALRALGVGPGDEVITVANTFIATGEAITMAGARPVFVDVREDTLLIDPAAILAAITPRTRAIIPVHLYGQPCEMTEIMEIAHRYGLKVVEDAAQAHGAAWDGQPVGALGDAACFSFYPGKNLGAYGDAGAVISKDPSVIEKVRMTANHGRLEKYTHAFEGVNSRLDSLQAAVLRVKLRHLGEWTNARRRHAALYRELLVGSGAVLPEVHPSADPVWHLYVLRVPDRESMQTRLRAKDIEVGVHYPVPLHLQPAYRHLGLREGTLPITERAAAEVLSLPMYAELAAPQIEQIALAVREELRGQVARRPLVDDVANRRTVREEAVAGPVPVTAAR